MNKYGYIKLPRSISALKGSKRWLLAHICSEAAYCTTEHPACGKIERGELVTSRNQLAEDVGLTPMQVRHALESLESLGYITVEAAARYTKITVTWPDFVQLRDNDIMLNNQSSNQVSNQTSNQMATSASVEDSARYEDSAERHAQSVAKAVTQSVTNNSINNNKTINTHTSSIYPVRDLKSAPARECAPASAYTSDTRVAELYEWMAKETPDLLAMRRTFEPAEVKEMVEGYPVDTLHTILREMWSKGVYCKEAWAKVVFDKYAKNISSGIATKNGERLLTWAEMLKQCDTLGIQQKDHFEPVPQLTGKPLWRRIN
jgi:predicted transcriptional regulator